jgi:hypothetical protein
MRLKVSPEKARKLIGQISHATCQKGAERHWNASEDGSVPEKSANWLFCWGKTGMGSARAAEESRHVFDSIMSLSFAQYDGLIHHEDARSNRYEDD